MREVLSNARTIHQAHFDTPDSRHLCGFDFGFLEAHYEFGASGMK